MVTGAPAPGAIGLKQLGGVGGPLIRFAQWLNGDGFTRFEHACLCVSVDGDSATVVEAMPSGARLHTYLPGDGVTWLQVPLTLTQRDAVTWAAGHYVGTRYSWLDYLAIAARRLHIPAPGLRHYIANTRHMICSQLVDQCFQDAGVHLFTDGRWPGDVTPGDLYKQLAKKEG